MTLNSLLTSPLIKSWFINQLGYYADGLFAFGKNGFEKLLDKSPTIIIVAKQYYTESIQSFSSINKKELQQIVKLKRQNETLPTTIFRSFENRAIDGFDVLTIVFEPKLIEALGHKKVLIPETVLFAHNPKKNNEDTEAVIYELESLLGTLFYAQTHSSVKSAYQKGVINSSDTFKLSFGAPLTSPVIKIAKENFSNFILEQLFNQSFDVLKNKISIVPKQWINLPLIHRLYLIPLMTAVAFYSLTNSYLYFKTSQIEDEINQGGSVVTELLNKKRVNDKIESKIATLSNEFSQSNPVHHFWNIIYHLVKNDMAITRVTYAGTTLVIRGEAEKASDVLGALTTSNYVNSASFEGPVRKSRGKDSFVLLIDPKKYNQVVTSNESNNNSEATLGETILQESNVEEANYEG